MWVVETELQYVTAAQLQAQVYATEFAIERHTTCVEIFPAQTSRGSDPNKLNRPRRP